MKLRFIFVWMSFEYLLFVCADVYVNIIYLWMGDSLKLTRELFYSQLPIFGYVKQNATRFFLSALLM